MNATAMNIEDFIKLERAGQLATRAAGIFASPEAAVQLDRLNTVLAELRHASLSLCDESAPVEVRQQALRRLASLFDGAASMFTAEVSA